MLLYDNMLSIITPEKLVKLIALKAKAARLSANLSRKSLSERSGIPESTIRHFEITGQVSLANLLSLAWILDDLNAFAELFNEKPVIQIEDLLIPKRRRGRS